MWKKVLFGIWVITFIMCLSGCSGNPDIKGKTKISLMYWGSPAEKAAVASYVKSFEKKYPHIYVELIHKPGSNYNDVLQTMIAGNNPPDVMYMGMEDFPFFASKGAFLNLDSCMSDDTTFNKSDFYELLMNVFKYNGIQYGIPKDFATLVLYYNKDLFDKAGVAYPNDNWTWKDFRSAAEKLTLDKDGDGKLDQYGFVVEPGLHHWQMWVWQNGGEVMSPDGKQWLLGDPKYKSQNIEALNYQLEMIYGPKPIAPTRAVTADRNTAELFKTGCLAMCATGRWMCMDYKDIKHFKWNIVPLPHNKKRAATLLTTSYAISSTTKHPKEAWELVKFLTGPDGQIEIAESGHAIPSMIKYAESDHFLKCPVLPSDLNNKANLDVVNYSRPTPTSPCFNEIADVLVREMDLVWNNKESPKEAIEKLQPKIEKIIKDNETSK